MRVELVTECAHGYEEEHYLCDEDQSEHDPLNFSCACPGGSRTTLDGAVPLRLCLQHMDTDDGTSMECRMVEGWWFPLPDKETP